MKKKHHFALLLKKAIKKYVELFCQIKMSMLTKSCLNSIPKHSKEDVERILMLSKNSNSSFHFKLENADSITYK